MTDHTEQAMTLLLVKDGLGEFYEEQKQLYLDTILALPMKEAAAALNSFVDIGFLTREELNANVKKLLSSQSRSSIPPSSTSSSSTSTSSIVANSNDASPSIPTTSTTTPSTVAQASPSEDGWGGNVPTLETRVPSIRHSLVRLASISEDQINSLIDSLIQLNVNTVKDAIQAKENNDKFNFLNDLMPQSVYSNFEKIVSVFNTLPCVVNDRAILDQQEKLFKEAATQLNNNQQVGPNLMHHLWNNNAQLLVVPLRNQYYFFCSVESTQSQDTLEKGEHLFFLLDVSASMNHDEKNSYCAPKSLDHPSSSIKKARELIPQLSVPALKRNISVTILIWNYKIQNTIEFSPTTFQDPETGVFQDDDVITAHVRRNTNEEVFKARGGTNIEAALKELSTKMKVLSAKVGQFSVWFLTDGEETVYNQPDGSFEHIPTNRTQGNFLYFSEENEEGTTPYQRKMISDLVATRDELRQRQSYIQFHACHFGEAHPLFLKSLATSVDGHFHTFKDVSNIARELNASMVSSSARITIYGCEGEQPEVFPAGLTEGYLCSRGELNRATFNTIQRFHKPKVSTLAGGDNILDVHSESEITGRVQDCIAGVIALEKDLERVLQSTSENVRMDKLRDSSELLHRLRQRRADLLGDIPREVRSNSMLMALLEKVLESVETQIESFTRLLEQFIKSEQTKYDKDAVTKNDMFTMREQLAISANVESMRVQLGKGIVAKNTLDKQIQKLVAIHGARAMRMLERTCLVAETIKGDITHLSLFIIEGRELKARRSQRIADVMAASNRDPSKFTTKYSEVLRHNDNNEVVADTKVTVHEGATLVAEIKETIPFAAMYPQIVESYHCAPTTDDLDDACKRLLDPLSFSHFLDLIRENNTLPAYLYTISKTQSPGLLFNAKEMMFVISGGSDSTSMDYFRLFWRLATKDANNCVKVPGTFAHANFALPIAPEPFTNTVLSCLMPGLLSEFITGTSMSPLPGAIDLYVGFLMLHMRGKHTGLDITRIAEILSTMRVWIDNPHTNPKPEAFRELIDQMVKEQGVSPSNSPGKLMPLKAFAYSLLDDAHAPAVKLAALYKETARRFTKQLLIPNSELNKNPKISPELAKNQVGLTTFFHDIVAAFAADNRVEDEIPVSFLAAAHKLSNLVVQNNPNEVLNFLEDPRNTNILVSALWKVLGEKASAAYPADKSWVGAQRMFAVWLSAATYPCSKLVDTFSKFKAPTEFESHMEKMLRRLVGAENSFNNVFYQWVEPLRGDDNLVGLMAFEFVNGVLLVRDTEFKSTPVFDCEPGMKARLLEKLWEFLHPFLNLWYWKNRPSTAYNLLELDYDIVRALRDPSLIASLSTVQSSELNAAREYKNPAYFKFVPPKPAEVQLSSEARFAATQSAKAISGKYRISIIFIGSGNCGKSTIAGHMLYKRGIIDDRVLRQYREQSNKIGKEKCEFAWILNRLKDERQQGRSIETHNWGLDTEKYEIDLLDAPGHSDFLKNMMVGSSMADIAIVVVSAATGEFEFGIARKGMTREEALVAYGVGIRRFIVLVTKMELANYSENRFIEISNAVVSYLRQLGITSAVSVIPVSGLVGDNLVEPSDKMPWYTASPRTFLEALDTTEPLQRMYDAPVKVPILRTYKIGGVGTVAVGRVASGSLKIGDTVCLQPSGIMTEVRSIEMYHTPRQVALPGDVVAFNLKAVSRNDIPRGLVAVPLPAKGVKIPRIISFTALLLIVDHPSTIKEGYSPFISVHTATGACRITKIINRVEKQTGKVLEESPKTVKKGDAAHVEITSQNPIYVEPVTSCPALARFVMKDGHGIVAIGVIKSVNETSAPAPPKAPSRNNKKR